MTTAVAVDANGLATPGSNFLQPSSTVLDVSVAFSTPPRGPVR